MFFFSEPCVTLMNDFISCFLFSLETQYSTGYGSRSPTTECPEGIFVLIVQSICGMLIQSIMTGIVFAKLARPKARTQNIMFRLEYLAYFSLIQNTISYLVKSARK